MQGASDSKFDERMILICIVCGTFMSSLDATIVAVALPTMAADFTSYGSTTAISWILLGYTLALCCFIILWGKIGTNYGYKNLFLIGVVIFSLMSFVIGLLGTINVGGLIAIIISRVLQGLGAGMIMSMGLAMVSSYLPNSRGKAVGVITLAASAGTAFGPVLGGVLCHFHWSYIFFINVPIGLICVLMSLRYMRNVVESHRVRDRLDIIGVVLMSVMMFSMIYYLNTANDNGWISEISVLTIAIAFISAGILIKWENHIQNPLVPTRLLKMRDVIGSNIVGLLLYAAMAGSYLLLPYYLELVLGYSTIEMGLIIVANSAGMMVVGPIVGRLSDKSGINSQMVSIGCIIGALGFFLMMSFGAHTGLLHILLALFIMGAGMGMGLVASTNLSLGYSGDNEEGMMSATVNTFRQAGSSIGVAVLESIFAAGIILPLIFPDSLVSAFRPAFFVACVICLIAFVISMFIKDRKVRDVSS